MQIQFAYIGKMLRIIGGAVPYTLFITAVSGILGLLLAVARGRGKGVLYHVLGVYVYLFRSTPCITHIFLAYYGVPLLMKLLIPGWEDTNGRTFYAILALSLFNGSHMSEFIRPAYLSVEKGQLDAADSIGMGAGSGLSG